MQYFRSLVLNFGVGKAIFSILSFRFLSGNTRFRSLVFGFWSGKAIFSVLSFEFLHGNAIFAVLSFQKPNDHVKILHFIKKD